jgi:hypothetical protein
MDYPALLRAARRKAAAELLGHAAAQLEDITYGRRLLRAVRHPLGFICFPVLREGSRGVCVHAFDGTEKPVESTASQIHSHSWDLTSTVLYGQVDNRCVRVDDEPDRPTHRVFEVHSDPAGVDELRPTTRLVRCLRGAEQTSVRGETYTLAAGEFHTTVVPDGRPAATLVLGQTLPDRMDLSLGPVHGAQHRVVRNICDAIQTARIARAAARRIHDHL